MTEPIRTSDTFCVALNNKRDVIVTPPWFAKSSNAYPPRPGNIVQPLINGERTFAAVSEAINNAKKTVDIISWGFDPSMRLLRPNGERLGDLLKRKSDCTDRKWGWRCGKETTAEIRILIWKDAIGNLGENNMPGDGLFGSGGGTGLGSGVGSGSAGGGSSAEREKEFNDYANKYTNSAAVAKDDDAAALYNREWFRYQPPGMQFRTRKLSAVEKHINAAVQVVQRGIGSPLRTLGVSLAATHHQKMILIDYESPEDAIGFVMGHNLLRNYWDTDTHDYFSALRHGFAPSRTYPVVSMGRCCMTSTATSARHGKPPKAGLAATNSSSRTKESKENQTISANPPNGTASEAWRRYAAPTRPNSISPSKTSTK